MNIITEQGFLSNEGKEQIKPFITEVMKLLAYAKSEQELRILGSVLSQALGDEISTIVSKTLKNT
jgi:hypothetical protein